jgi:hypothetical protein
MECGEIFYKAMVAFCRQHAKMQGENEHFWLDEAQTWTERLKAKNAFCIGGQIGASRDSSGSKPSDR